MKFSFSQILFSLTLISIIVQTKSRFEETKVRLNNVINKVNKLKNEKPENEGNPGNADGI